jgi:hypothetical protein
VSDFIIPEWMPDWAIPAVTAVGVAGYVAKTDIAKRVAATTLDAAKWGILQLRSEETRRDADRVGANRELSIGLSDIRRRSKANRLDVVLIHNGGGDILDAANPKYVSVWETCDEDVEQDSRVQRTKVRLDEAYRRDILMPLLHANGAVIDIHTLDLGEGNQLFDFFRRDSITFVTKCEACSTDDGYWLCDAQFKDLGDVSRDPVLALLMARQAARESAALVRRLAPRLRAPANPIRSIYP